MNGGQGGQAGNGDSATRTWLAIVMVSLSVGGTVAIAGLAIGFASNRGDTTRFVFTSLLPLFGTWVGTILAFYFARENLQAATDSTVRITAASRSPQTSVLQAMLPKAKITSYEVPAGGNADATLLRDLLARMRNAGVHRIPVLGSSGAVVYVVHDSTINAYADTLPHDPTDTAWAATVGQLAGQDPFGKAIKAIGVVGTGATLADARAAMGAVDGCNDVFVTTNGQRNDAMVGWLTNTDLASIS